MTQLQQKMTLPAAMAQKLDVVRRRTLRVRISTAIVAAAAVLLAAMAVAMIDVDHFKRVNDDFGHLCGDQALVKIAEVLKGSLRDYDLLGRYGGEEFAAVIVESDAEAAVKVAERCRRRVAEQSFTFAGTMQSITVSIGVSFTSSVCAGSLTEMIARADEALYLAKNRGRDQVVLAASDLVYVSEREKELEL